MLDSIRIIIAGIKNRGFVVKYAETASSASKNPRRIHVRQHDADAASNLGAAPPCGLVSRRYRNRLPLGIRRAASIHVSRRASAHAATGERAWVAWDRAIVARRD